MVTSPDHKTHKKHLRILFARLSEYGIIIGPEKCQFGTTELSFLGHHVCAEGISPLPSAVDAIVNFVKPEKQRALRRYLGMVNYYHRFIPHCAAKLTPFNNLLTAANEGHTSQNKYWQTLRFWCIQILRLRLTSRATLVMSPSVAFCSNF